MTDSVRRRVPEVPVGCFRESRHLLELMASFLLLFLFPGSFSCNVHKAVKNREKIVEDYVLLANFDQRKDLPQLTDRSRLGMFRVKTDEEDTGMESKDMSMVLPTRRTQGGIVDDFDDGKTMEDRDLLVHHHHIPPPHPPHPPPVPHPPVPLAYAPSLFAVGFVTFLILLNSLYTSLLLSIKAKNSLLGGKPLKRRKKRRLLSTPD